jgi:hypothetical protein
MSCICCEYETKDLGCGTNCDLIVTGLTGTINGDYKIYFEYLGVIFYKTLPFSGVGSFPINFIPDFMNENYQQNFYVIDPDGFKMILDESGTLYDCFTYTTILSIGV